MKCFTESNCIIIDCKKCDELIKFVPINLISKHTTIEFAIDFIADHVNCSTHDEICSTLTHAQSLLFSNASDYSISACAL